MFGDTSGAEVDGLRSALEKAKILSRATVEVQITKKSFIAWAEGGFSGGRTSQVVTYRVRSIAPQVVLPSHQMVRPQ